jgi:hypothetical protein
MKNDRQAEMVTNNTAGASPLLDQVEKTKVRSKSYVMDLRVHSPETIGYSGFSGLDSAPAIVRLAKVKGLDVIAITDLFSAQFVDRMVEAARGSALTVIPGVGLRCTVGTCRDVILSCLFPESAGAETINAFLRDLKVPTSLEERVVYTITQPLDQVLHALERYQGIAIPSRLDKTPHRMAVIPELVETYGFRAFDLAYADTAGFFKKRWPKLKFHLYSFSDANALAQIGSRIAKVKLSAPGFNGIREVVARENGMLAI